jgi:hypothetical protein
VGSWVVQTLEVNRGPAVGRRSGGSRFLGLVLRTTSDDPRNYDPYGRDVSTTYSHAVDVTASCTQRSLDPTVRAPSVKKSFWSYLDGFPDGFFARPPSPQTDEREARGSCPRAKVVSTPPFLLVIMSVGPQAS